MIRKIIHINRYKSNTKLSVEYWNLKAGDSNPKVTWTVKNQFSVYNPQSKRSSLYLNEKLKILEDKENNLYIYIYSNQGKN